MKDIRDQISKMRQAKLKSYGAKGDMPDGADKFRSGGKVIKRAHGGRVFKDIGGALESPMDGEQSPPRLDRKPRGNTTININVGKPAGQDVPPPPLAPPMPPPAPPMAGPPMPPPGMGPPPPGMMPPPPMRPPGMNTGGRIQRAVGGPNMAPMGPTGGSGPQQPPGTQPYWAHPVFKPGGPHGPTPPMFRKDGGHVVLDAGACSGEGRLEQRDFERRRGK